MERDSVSPAVTPEFKTTTIHCIVCGSDFLFSQREAKFFYDHDLLPPKRCPMCRKWKRYNEGVVK